MYFWVVGVKTYEGSDKIYFYNVDILKRWSESFAFGL